MSIYGHSIQDAPLEVLQQMAHEKARRLAVAMGEDLPEDEPEDGGDFCGGCNPEPTISELENGRCDSCGRELL